MFSFLIYAIKKVEKIIIISIMYRRDLIMKVLIICISIISFMLLFCPLALHLGGALLSYGSLLRGGIAVFLILTSYFLYAVNHISLPINILLMIVLCILSVRKKKHLVRIIIFVFFNIIICMVSMLLIFQMRAIVV